MWSNLHKYTLTRPSLNIILSSLFNLSPSFSLVVEVSSLAAKQVFVTIADNIEDQAETLSCIPLGGYEKFDHHAACGSEDFSRMDGLLDPIVTLTDGVRDGVNNVFHHEQYETLCSLLSNYNNAFELGKRFLYDDKPKNLPISISSYFSKSKLGKLFQEKDTLTVNLRLAAADKFAENYFSSVTNEGKFTFNYKADFDIIVMNSKKILKCDFTGVRVFLQCMLTGYIYY